MKVTLEEFKKYAAMYWGQRVLKFGKTAPATQFVNSSMMDYMTKDCVLELRPFSDMTEEEAKIFMDLRSDAEVYKKDVFDNYIEFKYKWFDEDVRPTTHDGKCYSAIGIGKDAAKLFVHPEKLLYLLKQGFDLFNLIPEGLAIDKTKL